MADSAAPEVVISNNETPDSSANRSERVAANNTIQNTTQLSAEQVAGAATAAGNSQSGAAPLQRQHASIQIDVNQMANVISVSYLAANGLNNQRNRAGAAGVNFGGTGPGQNNIMHMRNRLFHAIYFKVALTYAQMFPKPFQRVLEYFFLLKALLFFSALVYVHVSFIKNPATCLDHVHDWPRDGVLRVEVIPNLDKRIENYKRIQAYENSMRKLQNDYFYGIGPKTKNQLHHHKYATNETYTYYLQHESTYADYLKTKELNNEYKEDNDNNYDDEQYIIEYSLEYGHLRLSPAARKRLQIPVRVVQLDPLNNKCFGNKFSKFLLKDLLGYDDLLMASVRVIAEKEDNKGYLRNVITGEHYRFISTWWTSCSSYPTAFFVMLLFTFSISMLLRFSHQQIFVFIVDLLQMLEFNVAARFPIAPLLIVILALVGMEAIMSEFFNDTTTAFYIILIVWVADQYDAICCHTSITKRHWLRFFYLYHFAFYAYHYRFCGQNRSLALVSSWLFIQHSMLYFFHHYELPVIVQQVQVIVLNRNQNNNGGGAGGGGVGVHIVTGVIQQQQQQQQPQQQQQHPQQQQQASGNGDAIVTNRILRLMPLQQEQHANATGQQGVGGQIDGLQMQPQQLPFVGGLLQHYAEQNIGGALGMIRRALFARGWRQPIPARLQTAGNLQRINLGSIQINPENLARVSSPSPSPTPTTQTATVIMATAPMATNTESNTTVSSDSNATVDTTSSTTTISSGIFNTIDVETTQRNEYSNPTSGNNINATDLTAKETEALGNTQLHNENQTIEEPTIYKVALANNSAETSYTLAVNAKEAQVLTASGQLDDKRMTMKALKSAEIPFNNKSADDIIFQAFNNANMESNSNNKDTEGQQFGVEQQLPSIYQAKDKDLNCLEKQNKTIANNEENIKGYRAKAIAANEGSHEATETIHSLSNTSTIGAASTQFASTQNETKQIDVKPVMIDDGTTNKPVTTTNTSDSSSSSSPAPTPSPLPSPTPSSTTSELNETEISTQSAGATAAVPTAASNIVYNTNCSSNSHTSPRSRLYMVVSGVASTSTTTSLPNITQSNHNQLLNPTANASATASNPATTSTSITDLMTSDADDVQSTST